MIQGTWWNVGLEFLLAFHFTTSVMWVFGAMIDVCWSHMPHLKTRDTLLLIGSGGGHDVRIFDCIGAEDLHWRSGLGAIASVYVDKGLIINVCDRSC